MTAWLSIPRRHHPRPKGAQAGAVRWSLWLGAGVLFGLAFGFAIGLAKPRFRT